jgi:hypothetical protein
MAPAVGAAGIEPATSCSQSTRATRLRYAPRASSLPFGGREGYAPPMAGDVRPSPGYYVAIALLAAGLLAGASLFLLLATRSQTTTAPIEIGSPQPTPCAVGGHAPVCYNFTVKNVGHGPVYATCELNAAAGTSATFDDGQLVKPVSLLEGQTRDLSVRVQADGSDTVSEPHMTCNPSAV